MRIFSKSRGVTAIVAASILGSVVATAQPVAAAEPVDIVATAQSAGQFTTLIAAAQAAGLVDALKGPGPLTVFAPTDAAFTAALSSLGITASQLLSDPVKLAAILKYHVVSGKVLAADIPAGVSGVPTVNGKKLFVVKNESGVTINKAKVVTADVIASNGVIHIIDGVLLPPSDPTIVDVAQSAGMFTTLLAAAEAAGLVDALKAEGPLTVFAPTDAAFKTLLRRLHLTPAKLLANKAALTKILTYHVVPSKVLSSDLKSRQRVTTLNGATIIVRKSAKGVTVNGTAKVTTADLTASNGVVHVINRVLIPRNAFR